MQDGFSFSVEFQEAIIGHCLINDKFFFKCQNKLKSVWFTDMMLATLFEQLVLSYKRYQYHFKSVDEFKSENFFLEQDEDKRQKFYNTIDRCVFQAQMGFDLDKITYRLTGFLKMSIFKEGLQNGANAFNKQGFDKAWEFTRKKLAEIEDASFEDNGLILDFSNPLDWIVRQEIKRKNAISTGSALLDKALGGGLFPSETCAFMAPSNTGKTTALVTIIRHALKQRKKVLFFLHEGNPEEIRLRILLSFMCVTKDMLYSMVKEDRYSQIIIKLSEHINKFLTFVPYVNTNSMFVEDVITMAKTLNQEQINKTGTGYDLIVDDYPKKLKSRHRAGSKDAVRHELAEVYDAFNFLAAELDTHCFVAIQTNRTGLKQNNGKVESEYLLGMEEVDEAFGIIQNLANVISLNRSPEDKAAKIVRMNIAKSRNEATDVVINTRTNYASMLLFGDKEYLHSGGLWPQDLGEHGFLESYMQDNNYKFDTSQIDQGLRKVAEQLKFGDAQ